MHSPNLVNLGVRHTDELLASLHALREHPPEDSDRAHLVTIAVADENRTSTRPYPPAQVFVFATAKPLIGERWECTALSLRDGRTVLLELARHLQEGGDAVWTARVGDLIPVAREAWLQLQVSLDFAEMTAAVEAFGMGV